MNAHIVTLPGDGIGPEVTAEAVRVLEAIAKHKGHSFSFAEYPLGGCSIEEHGVALTEETLSACKAADAVLLGAVGGPKWDNPTAPVRPEQGLLAIRKGLGLYANLRPVRSHPALLDSSPVKAEILEGVDLLVVRELTGGLYFGEPKGRFEENGRTRAVDTMEYYDFEVERILNLAFYLAKSRRKKVTSVDKANVLETSKLWRQIATDLGKGNPDVSLEHMLVDTASMRLITSPANFDVIVTENTFGDILTDEASVLAGSMGLLPSASLGEGGPGLFEPIHGSAPDIAGRGIANPIGSILSAALLLRYGLRLEQEASAVEAAVDKSISDGLRTTDLGGRLTTRQMSQAIIDRIV
ncbi:MAG: 3-isopropylmalate dehydrogenase [Ignavibacteria bacterium]|nr:3-isopropylmalate dehydrogenase [Ignavibacteria bacterium]